LISSIEYLLRALGHAQQRQFIEYETMGNNGLICDSIDEHLHYASPVNGSVHIVVPGKLVVIPDPADLPDDQLWEDTCTDTGTSRAFSARYYADLLVHLDVRLVANLASDHGACDSPAWAGAGPVAAFEAVGLACEEDLRPSGGTGASLLRSHDRLMTLVRTAPGAVALLCGGAAAALTAGTVVTAVLMEQEGFGAAEAEAWLRLMCPRLFPEGDRQFDGTP
jgi:hypothetical protein